MNEAQRLQISKMKAEVWAKYQAATTDKARAKAEKEWAAILKAEADGRDEAKRRR